MNYAPDPNNYWECKYWKQRQAFAYDMLVQKVTFPLGREIVDGHKMTGDAQQVFYELGLQAQASTEALVVNQGVKRTLYSEYFDPKGNESEYSEYNVRLTP